jgi:hypothetical protein
MVRSRRPYLRLFMVYILCNLCYFKGASWCHSMACRTTNFCYT